MSLNHLRKTAILRQWHQQQQDQQMILETSETVEELKSKLISMENAHKKTYKRFWYSWGSVKSEEDHEKRRLHNDKLGACCFVHLVGAPQKDNRDWPLLPYQKLLWRMLHERRRLWIKKARGIGLSTLMLYIIAYKCLTEFKPGDRVVIITGIRVETVVDLIRRFKLLFAKNFPGVYSELIKQKDTIAILNNVIVEGYPARTDTARGLDKVKFCWVDEADMFPPAESQAVRSVIEALIAKPNSENMYLVLSSTPNKPGGLFETIEKEQNSLYYKMFLPYQYGLEGKYPIYTKEQLDQARLSPDFAKEFEGKYIGSQGNVIDSTAIDRCLQLGEQMNETTPIDDWSIQTDYVMAIDAGYGSSNTAITISRFVNNKVQLLYAKEFTRPNFSNIIDTVWDLKNRCPSNCLRNIIIDASNSELYTALSTEFNQNPSPKYLADKQTFCKKINAPLENYLFVVPVPFSVRGREILSHLKYVVEEQDDEDGTAMFALDKRFEEVITCLRTAQATDGLLDKSATAFDDTLDSLRLNLSYYRRSV